MFDFLFVGVAAPEDAGVDVEGVDGSVVMFSVDGGCEGSVGVMLRDGEDSCKVDASSSLSSATVAAGSSGSPSSISRTSVGMFVEAERNSRTLATVCTGRTLSLMAVKQLSVTRW